MVGLFTNILQDMTLRFTKKRKQTAAKEQSASKKQRAQQQEAVQEVLEELDEFKDFPSIAEYLEEEYEAPLDVEHEDEMHARVESILEDSKIIQRLVAKVHAVQAVVELDPSLWIDELVEQLPEGYAEYAMIILTEQQDVYEMKIADSFFN